MEAQRLQGRRFLRRPCARAKACRGAGRGGLSGNRFFKRAGRAWRKHGYSRAPCERLCKPLQQNRPCRRRRRIFQARRTKRPQTCQKTRQGFSFARKRRLRGSRGARYRSLRRRAHSHGQLRHQGFYQAAFPRRRSRLRSGGKYGYAEQVRRRGKRAPFEPSRRCGV